MAEAEIPVTEPETMQPIRGKGGSMLERWVDLDPKKALERVETIVRTLEELRKLSIRATYPTDWIIHTSTDQDGAIISQKGYLQDIGAERAGKPWGIEVGSPAIEREEFPDGTYAYHMIAEAWCKVTGERLDYVEGSRWSGDPFFQRGGEKPDPVDIRKAAWANVHGRAVRSLSGLNGVPLDKLEAAGLDISKVVHVTYGRGTKGGAATGAAVGTSEVVMAWGNAKGTKVADLTEKDLTYYVTAYERDIANPEKAKYLRHNQRVLDALKAEVEKRGKAGEQGKEAGPAPNGKGVAEGAPTTRGQKVANVHTMFSDTAKGDGRLVAAMLRTYTKDKGQEHASLSSLTDEQLDELLKMTDTQRAELAKKAGGAA